MQLALVTKVAERCNLACSYCYMYEGKDDTWRERPHFLSHAHAEKLVDRLAEFTDADPSHGAVVELHGGEPLLWGRARMESFAASLRARTPHDRVDVCLQTNGLLLDRDWLDLFSHHGVGVSISCDGPPELHDKRRRSASGAPTGRRVIEAIRLASDMDNAEALFGGVLAVADLDSDPGEVIRFFHELGVRDFDLLLPDATREQVSEATVERASRFLDRAFDAWLALDDPEFEVRFLREFALGVLGRRSSLDAFGGDLSGLLVLESDGTLQLLDVLRVCERDAAWTGMHIETESLEEFVGRAAGLNPQPSATCRSCRAFSACGGGYLPHRYDGRSYDNPSAYCDALLALYDRMLGTFGAVLPAHAWRSRPAPQPNAARAAFAPGPAVSQKP